MYITYILQFLDKATLSYASVFGLQEETGLVGSQYSWLGSIVYVAQLVMQPLIAVALVKLPTGKFLGIMVLCWGAVLCCMVAATNFGGLLAARFFLGAFESSIAPCFVAIVGMWWKRSEQTNRNAIWYSTLGIVNMIGPLLAYGLGHIQSATLSRYQVIFLFCGAITVVYSVVVFLFMPDSPMEAKFLKHNEKLIAIERVRINQQGIASRKWRWDHVKESFLDPKTWLWFCMIFSISIPSGGISTFGPLIVQSFGYDSFTTILFNIPFGFVQLCVTLGASWLATRYKRKGPILALLCIPPIIGCAILMAVDHVTGSKGVLLFAYYIISFYPAITPLIYSWSSQNTAGDTKRKVTTAFIFVGQSAGNIVGPQLYKPKDKPQYYPGLISNMILFVVLIGLVGVTTLWIAFLNKRHADMREQVGKPRVIVDRSMQTERERKDKLGESEYTVDADQEREMEHTLEDMTDLRNEDFVFVY